MAIYLDFATGFNFPPYWLNRKVAAQSFGSEVYDPAVALDTLVQDLTSDGDRSSVRRRKLQDSIRVKWDDETDWWTFPLDPVVSISCKNIIVRRRVLKVNASSNRRGTIKEVWSQDDYEINIAGVLMNDENELPETDLRRLRRYCEARKPLLVESKLFTIFDIERIVIEDYSLPFTKGIENQMYNIKAYSDDEFDLLVKS
jgi:hypothetical protein